jgi:hypothetical protein
MDRGTWARTIAARGHETRCARAALKKALRAGAISPVDLLLDPPDALDRLEVGRFLDWLPWIGAKRARRLVLGIAEEHTPIGQIDAERREQLAERLRPRFAVAA